MKSAIDTHNATNKKAVQFGISPFGIWEHKALDPRGSNTPQGSSQSYSKTIFADTYQWVKDEKLDYIAPQIYWSFAAPAAPYGELARWWDEVAEGTNVDVYVGHSNYKHETVGGWDADWMNPEEVNNQLHFNQKYKNITGSAIYSYNELVPTGNPSVPKSVAKDEAIEILKNDSFSTLSLTPQRPKLSHNDTSPVDEVVYEDGKLSWSDQTNTNARFYVVYVGDETTPEELIANPSNIYKKVMSKGIGEYELELDESLKEKNVAITVLDRAFVETAPTAPKVEEEFVASIEKDEIELTYNTPMSEEDFISSINVQANKEYTVTTDFSSVVKFDEAKEYEVKVNVKSNSDETVISFTVKVKVLDNNVDPTDGFEAEIEVEDVEFTFGDVINEEQFIAKLKIKSNMKFDVTTDFSNVVNPNKAGTYKVTVTLTPVKKGRAITIDKANPTFSVNVKVMEKDGTVKPTDPTTPTNPTKPGQNGGGKTPSTGIQVSQVIPTVGIVVALGAMITVVVLKKKKSETK